MHITSIPFLQFLLLDGRKLTHHKRYRVNHIIYIIPISDLLTIHCPSTFLSKAALARAKESSQRLLARRKEAWGTRTRSEEEAAASEAGGVSRGTMDIVGAFTASAGAGAGIGAGIGAGAGGTEDPFGSRSWAYGGGKGKGKGDTGGSSAARRQHRLMEEQAGFAEDSSKSDRR